MPRTAHSLLPGAWSPDKNEEAFSVQRAAAWRLEGSLRERKEQNP